MIGIKAGKKFVGRKYELELLAKEYKKNTPAIIVLYGRRRVGKTRLINEYFNDKNLWQFDGIEGKNTASQIEGILNKLSIYAESNLYRQIKSTDWIEILKILDNAISKSPGAYNKTIFFDEFQYMAARRGELVSAIKWAWDNLWQDKIGLTLILCGSVASFMIERVVKSSALYGRIRLEICLKPLPLSDVYNYFEGRISIREICDLYMFCGGIPEYLAHFDPSESVYQNISRIGFCKDGYFVNEFDRIFKDIFREERIYKKICIILSKFKSLNAKELTKALKVSGGGGFIEFLKNLESAGFIRSVTPLDKPAFSKLKRYKLDDEYLLFYLKFIYSNLSRITNNTSIDYGISLLKGMAFKVWAGFAFERLCLKHVNEIMNHLKIDQLVINYGPYFNRRSNFKDGCQIDLMFMRYDPVVTICEMKFCEGLVGKWIIKELENKIALINVKNKTVERVLITTNGITKELKDTNYFSKVILLDELFST